MQRRLLFGTKSTVSVSRSISYLDGSVRKSFLKCRVDSIELPCVEHVYDRIYFSPRRCTLQNQKYIGLSVSDVLEEIVSPENFVPFNLGQIHQFCDILDGHLRRRPHLNVVVTAGPARDGVASAVFLLGAYMVLRLAFEAHAVSRHFARFLAGPDDDRQSETEAPGPPPRDIPKPDPPKGNSDSSELRLRLADCWGGLHRARALGWAGGRFDAARYAAL